jgi:hypothetical protein
MAIKKTLDAAMSNSTGNIYSTLLFGLTLFLTMIALGVGSGFWAYSQGGEALKGVTKPDDSPTKKLTGKLKESQQKQPQFLDEQKIIKKLDLETKKSTKTSDTEQKKGKTKADTATAKEKTTKDESDVNFPLTTKKNGVTLEILKVSREGNSLTLDVNLRNEGSQSVRFLYSFLEVRDDRDRALSAITDGLPSELPVSGDNFTGTIRIPTALLDEVKSLSLTLTDYPDQKLELKLDKIPVGD